MRIFGILCATLALLLFTLPVLVFDVSGGLAETVKSGVAAFSGDGQTKTQNTNETVADTVTVLQAASGNVIETDTVEYLVGCLACELQPDTPTEALKAQAVAAYTNVVRLKKIPTARRATRTSPMTQDFTKAITTNRRAARNGAISTIPMPKNSPPP
ncbi:MAG: SpoIID/LytB domain-containing protein [Clostridia bacterium]|nr:SpoIID/LytB domain-containing protein [Clostridia bacterium]